jgi:beta-lactamase regulating signal transducer with metallopeptidase domain
MADLLTFLHLCAASGTLIGSLCGLIFIPLLTWLGVRALAPFILRMRDDAAWQAPLAAIAATTPGAMFLLLALVGLFGASGSGCLAFVWGRVLFGAIAVLLALALSRAALRAHERSSQVRKLIDISKPANSSIGAIAQRCGVRVRVVNYADAFCALVGSWNPVVLISRATIDRLSIEELEAALQHERAHAARFDLMLAAALSFFADLLPLPADDLVETYSAARERAADERAVQHCDPTTLASAIVAVATTRNTRAVAALAEETHSAKQRVLALLSAGAEQVNPRRRRLTACVSLGVIVALSVAPAIFSATHFYTCAIKGMHV